MHREESDQQLILSLIGSGACGKVFRSTDGQGREIAVKKYDTSAINCNLLRKSLERLRVGEWPKHAMPILSASYDMENASRLTALYLGDNGLPHTLQHRFRDFSGANAWPLVHQLAIGLSEFHECQVAHGNLKPGNVFFTKSGEILLTDWCSGLMPDVANQEYTDAFLYAPPEQLLEPEGYYFDAGYRWDVYAFGVLAFRLLTGTFPRCHEIFNEVDPIFDAANSDGVIADIASIAQHLTITSLLPWPTIAADQQERESREVILRCLNLNPACRPATMVEVHREFCEIDLRKNRRSEKNTPDQVAVSPQASPAWRCSVAALLLVLLLVASSSYFQNNKKNQQISNLLQRNDESQVQLTQALTDSQNLLKKIDSLQAEYDHEKRLLLAGQHNNESAWLAQIMAMKQNTDILFESVFEPTDRLQSDAENVYRRLALLEGNLTQFLSLKSNDLRIVEQLPKVRLQLAEIALHKKDDTSASLRLMEAIAAHDLKKAPAAFQVRVAADLLHLAMLQQLNGRAESSQTFQDVRKALAAIPPQRDLLDRTKLLRAILNYKEAQNFSASGDHAKALEQLHAATSQFNDLTKAHPDSAYLRKELSECFLASANVLENMNDLGNAREVRNLAVAELSKIVAKHPQDPSFQLKLCETYTTLAHAAFLAGDISSLEQHNKDAQEILNRILAKDPRNQSAATKLAAHTYFRSSLKQDTGDAAAALTLCNEGIKLLDFTLSEKIQDPLPHYYRALLLWQKGRLLGVNSRDQEIALEKEAQAILVGMKNNGLNPHLRKEHILMNLAQLLSDIAHAYHRSQQPNVAKEHFLAAEKEWLMLAEIHPENLDYRGQVLWCRERLKEL